MLIQHSNPMSFLSHRHDCKQRIRLICSNAFTLVELLVVIGIIALLISILLPALSRARQAAQRAQCSAKLHNIMVAANVHAADHQGYFPLAGLLTVTGPVKDAPTGFDDTGTQKYLYLSLTGGSFNGSRFMAPICSALGYEMNYKNMVLSNYNGYVAGQFTDTTTTAFTPNFLCPSSPYAENANQMIPQHCCTYTATGSDGVVVYSQPTTYIFNEAVLGVNDAAGRLRGKVSRIRQSALTMFAMDGVGDSSNAVRPNIRETAPNGLGMTTVYNVANAGPVTLDQAVNGSTNVAGPCVKDSNVAGAWDTVIYAAGSTGGEDVTKRHQQLINIAFCDGHVEARSTKSVPSAAYKTGKDYPDLANVFLLAP